MPKQTSQFARVFPHVFVAFLLVTTIVFPAVAQTEPAPATQKPVKVGLYISPPFVMQEDERFTGMAIDLWETFADHLSLESQYEVFATPRELVDATAAGRVDAAVTNLAVTQDRAKRVDFTQPWFDSGLRIMINRDRKSGFSDVIGGLHNAGYAAAYAWIVAVIVIATLLLTLFDRRFDKDFPKRWIEGLAESFYSVMSIATSGKAPRKNLFGWAGRIWSALWLVCGVAVLAYVTASVTSVMTTLSLTNQIRNVEDLAGRPVGVFAGSVAEQYAQDSGLALRSFEQFDEATDALIAGNVDAIIGDAPVLEYYAYTNPSLPLDVVGRLFEPDKYAFALARDTGLRKQLTVEVLGAREKEVVERLRSKYFGDTP